MTGERGWRPVDWVSNVSIALLVVLLTLPITWVVYWNILMLEWVGLAFLILSLPLGPAAALFIAKRISHGRDTPSLVSLTVGTWLGIGAAFTASSLLGRREELVAQLNPLVPYVAGAFFGALAGQAVWRQRKTGKHA